MGDKGSKLRNNNPELNDDNLKKIILNEGGIRKIREDYVEDNKVSDDISEENATDNARKSSMGDPSKKRTKRNSRYAEQFNFNFQNGQNGGVPSNDNLKAKIVNPMKKATQFDVDRATANQNIEMLVDCIISEES